MGMRMAFVMMMIVGVALMVLGTGAILAQEDTYTVDGVELTVEELGAYQAQVATEIGRMRAVKSRGDEALAFLDGLDMALFMTQERADIDAAKSTVRMAIKRTIEALGAAPSTAASVKQELVERKLEKIPAQAGK